MNMLSDTDRFSLLLKAMDAAVKAGEVILGIYAHPFEVAWKDDQSPVTQADMQAHHSIVQSLRDTSFPVRSEEGGSSWEHDWNQHEPYWLVDPLDGTREFIRRNGEFTVNIALLVHSSPVLGVVYAPVTRMLYAGVPGLGYLQEKLTASPMDISFGPEKLKGSPDVIVKKTDYVVAVSRSHADEQTEEYLKNLKTEQTIRTIAAGSSIKFCLVASGEADEYPRFGRTMEWDTAAAQAILMAVGKNIYSLHNGRPLQYGKKDPVNDPFIAR